MKFKLHGNEVAVLFYAPFPEPGTVPGICEALTKWLMNE